MEKSMKWLKLDPDKEEECDPHHSAACSLRLKKQVNDRCWRLSTSPCRFLYSMLMM